jgi:hypothetical protein
VGWCGGRSLDLIGVELDWEDGVKNSSGLGGEVCGGKGVWLGVVRFRNFFLGGVSEQWVHYVLEGT